MKPAPRPRRPPYWALLALAGLLVLPVTGVLVVSVAAVAISGIAAAVRRSAARRSAAAEDAAARGQGAVVLGADDRGRPVALTEPQLAAHGLIVGASGAGKSTTLLAILEDRIRAGGPVVAIDLKGSPGFAGRLQRAAQVAGRPFTLWTPDGPGNWNPLAHGNATVLKDKLIGAERFSEPHYMRAAERYLQTVFRVLQAAAPDHAPRLDQVVALMEPRRLSGMLRQLEAPLAEQVLDYLGGMTPDQLSAVRGLGTRLALLTESAAGPHLLPATGAGHTIDLRHALQGPEVVVFSLNSSLYGKLAAQLGTLAIQDLTAAVGRRQALTGQRRPPQAMIAVDEFSALGADNLLALLARGRDAGASVLVATQELTDLDRAAPGFREQVLGIISVKIAHRQDVPASARLIADMIGTEPVWEETRNMQSPFGRRTSSLGTRREVERFVVHPNEIKSLPTGEAVLITKTPRSGVTRVRVTPPPDAPGAAAQGAAQAEPDAPGLAAARAAQAEPAAPRAAPAERASSAPVPRVRGSDPPAPSPPHSPAPSRPAAGPRPAFSGRALPPPRDAPDAGR
ncbi:MAG TPA: helicase HerA-like domain-containing protein [Solirubrobacteraceae bacterium]